MSTETDSFFSRLQKRVVEQLEYTEGSRTTLTGIDSKAAQNWVKNNPELFTTESRVNIDLERIINGDIQHLLNTIFREIATLSETNSTAAIHQLHKLIVDLKSYLAQFPKDEDLIKYPTASLVIKNTLATHLAHIQEWDVVHIVNLVKKIK